MARKLNKKFRGVKLIVDKKAFAVVNTTVEPVEVKVTNATRSEVVIEGTLQPKGQDGHKIAEVAENEINSGQRIRLDVGNDYDYFPVE